MANLNFNLILPDRNFDIFLSANSSTNYNIRVKISKDDILKCIGNEINDNNIEIPAQLRDKNKEINFKYKIYLKYVADTENGEQENENIKILKEIINYTTIGDIETDNINITDFITAQDILKKEVVCEIQVSSIAFFANITGSKDFDVVSLRPEKDLKFKIGNSYEKVGAVFRYSPISAMSNDKFLNFNQNEQFFVIPIKEGYNNRFNFRSEDGTRYFYYDKDTNFYNERTYGYFNYVTSINPLIYYAADGTPGAASFDYRYNENTDSKTISNLTRTQWDSADYRDTTFERTKRYISEYNESTDYSYEYTRGIVSFESFTRMNGSYSENYRYYYYDNNFHSSQNFVYVIDGSNRYYNSSGNLDFFRFSSAGVSGSTARRVYIDMFRRAYFTPEYELASSSSWPDETISTSEITSKYIDFNTTSARRNYTYSYSTVSGIDVTAGFFADPNWGTRGGPVYNAPFENHSVINDRYWVRTGDYSDSIDRLPNIRYYVYFTINSSNVDSLGNDSIRYFLGKDTDYTSNNSYWFSIPSFKPRITSYRTEGCETTWYQLDNRNVEKTTFRLRIHGSGHGEMWADDIYSDGLHNVTRTSYDYFFMGAYGSWRNDTVGGTAETHESYGYEYVNIRYTNHYYHNSYQFGTLTITENTENVRKNIAARGSKYARENEIIKYKYNTNINVWSVDDNGAFRYDTSESIEAGNYNNYSFNYLTS